MAQYKILLVDDEVDVRESIARTVDWEACGFSLCGCAAGALEALEMAKDLVPDVVMTDICMPYMDGLELIERLQQMYPAMRFVVVSGHDDFAYAQRAMQFRVMDYLLKPLSLTGVREALARIRAAPDEAFARRLGEAACLEQQRQAVALGAMVEQLGGRAWETADGLVIRGCRLTGGVVDSAGDHRIAMAAAIAATACTGPVRIRGAEAVEKSYPRFWQDYRALGGNWKEWKP